MKYLLALIISLTLIGFVPEESRAQDTMFSKSLTDFLEGLNRNPLVQNLINDDRICRNSSGCYAIFRNMNVAKGRVYIIQRFKIRSTGVSRRGGFMDAVFSHKGQDASEYTWKLIDISVSNSRLDVDRIMRKLPTYSANAGYGEYWPLSPDFGFTEFPDSLNFNNRKIKQLLIKKNLTGSERLKLDPFFGGTHLISVNHLNDVNASFYECFFLATRTYSWKPEDLVCRPDFATILFFLFISV